MEQMSGSYDSEESEDEKVPSVLNQMKGRTRSLCFIYLWFIYRCCGYFRIRAYSASSGKMISKIETKWKELIVI
jgi:hypothetical protein